MDEPTRDLDLEQLLSESEAIEAELTHALAQHRAFRERLAAKKAQQAPPETGPRYRNAADAFKKRGFPFNDQQMRRICRSHAIGTKSPDPFARKLTTDGVWHVEEPAFSDFCDRVDRGEATF